MPAKKVHVTPHAILNARDFAGRESFTAGIQEAVDALPAGGGTVFLPAGAYLLRRRVRLRARVTLRGEGAATLLTRPPQRFYALKKKTRKRPSHVVLDSTRGLRVGDELYLRDEMNYSYGAAHGIVRELRGNTVGWELLDSDPQYAYTPGPYSFAANWFPALWIHEADRVTLEHLSIEGGIKKHVKPKGDFTCDGVHARRSSDLRVLNVSVRNWPADGIGVQKGSGSLVSGCFVEHCCGHGYHPGTSIVSSVWVNNQAHRNSVDGFYFCLNVVNAVVQGNIFQGNGRHGIGGLTFPDRCNAVLGNVCSGNGAHGIDAANAVGNTIQGNIVRNNSQLGPGKFAGIYLEKHRENVVKDNVCADDQEKPTQLEGLRAFNPSGKNIIADNLCYSQGLRPLENARPVPLPRKAY